MQFLLLCSIPQQNLQQNHMCGGKNYRQLGNPITKCVVKKRIYQNAYTHDFIQQMKEILTFCCSDKWKLDLCHCRLLSSILYALCHCRKNLLNSFLENLIYQYSYKVECTKSTCNKQIASHKQISTWRSGVLNVISKSSRLEVFCKESVLKNFAIFTLEHLCWSRFLIKLQALKACNFIKKKTPTQLLSCDYCKFFKSTYFEEHLQTIASEFILLNQKESRLVKITNLIETQQIQRRFCIISALIMQVWLYALFLFQIKLTGTTLQFAFAQRLLEISDPGVT